MSHVGASVLGLVSNLKGFPEKRDNNLKMILVTLKHLKMVTMAFNLGRLHNTEPVL